MAGPFVIISGIGPNAGGTGLLMQGLIAEAKGSDVRFVYRDKTRPRGWARLNPVWFIRQRWNRLWFGAQARRAARTNGETLLLHPQSFAPDLFASLIESRAHSWVYVLDAYLFCERSYNVLPGGVRPCLRCHATTDAEGVRSGCFGAGRGWPLRERFAGWVRSGKIRLVAQCASQARFWEKHYGLASPIPVVPLMVPDLEAFGEGRAARVGRPKVVFHGSPNAAKGIFAVRELAQRMPGCDFLVPASLREVARHGGPTEGWSANVAFERMSWSDGLEGAVREAELVLCPSAWSAPVEGAVLKSMAHNGLVGLIPDATAFAGEVPAEARLDLDPQDWDGTAVRLTATLADPARCAAVRAAARRYIDAYRFANAGMLRRLREVCRLDPESA